MTPKESLLWKLPWATFGRAESSEQFFSKVDEQKTRVPFFKKPVKLSVVLSIVPHSTDQELGLVLESLSLQSFSEFELVIAGELPPRWKKFIQEKTHLKVRWVDWSHPFSPYAVKNKAAELAQGEWLCFLDSKEVLSPAALFEFALQVERDSFDLAYCNTINLGDKGFKVRETISKCEFSWFTLLHHNYIGSFYWIRKSLFLDIQFRLDLGNQADQALLLAATERSSKFHLIPLFLHFYTGKPRAKELSIEPIAEHLQTKKFEAKLSIRKNRIEVCPVIPAVDRKLVSVIICFKNKAEWTLKAIKHLRKQIGSVPVEFILVNNGSNISELKKIQDGICSENDVQLISYSGSFNFAHMHNLAIREKAKGDFLLLLNNDVFWKGTHHLDDLVAWAQQDWVGTVGILLRYEHGAIQHAGLNVRFGGEARLVRVGNAQTEDSFSSLNHEVFGNTFAACMFRREVYDRLGGFRELDIPNGFGDVSFNFECLKAGLKNLYLGQIEALHLESASRGTHYEYWEECIIEREYPEILAKMLRSDLGTNRVPENDLELTGMLIQFLKRELRVKFPWLIGLKRMATQFSHRVPRMISSGSARH